MSLLARRSHPAVATKIRHRAALSLAVLLSVASAATMSSPAANAAGVASQSESTAHSSHPTIQELTVAHVGRGTVRSHPGRIKCGHRCSASVPDGTVVSLVEHPRAGWTFAGWTGDCSGTGTCQVTMTDSKAVTATFTATAPIQHTLTTEICEDCLGTITSSPAGINCPADCTEDYADGTVVTLTETPAVGWSFTQWAGACNDSSPTCTVTMDDAKFVRAFFLQDIYRLDVSVDGVIGAGRVISDPGVIRCPEFDCWWTYLSGTVVHLTPIAEGGFKFYGWSGACSGTGSCDIVMNSDESATADFDCQPVRCKSDTTAYELSDARAARLESAQLGGPLR